MGIELLDGVTRSSSTSRTGGSPGRAAPVAFVGRFVAGRIWRYELEPVEGGTLVRESWDISRDHQRALLRLGWPARARRPEHGATLEQIEEIVTADLIRSVGRLRRLDGRNRRAPGVGPGMTDPLRTRPRHRGQGRHRRRRAGRHHPAGRGGRGPRLPPDVGGRAPRHAGRGQLRPGRPGRPPGRRHHHPAGRGRWRHAAQPCTPGGGRAVRHPGGPPPRSHRPRPRACPGTDPATARALRRAADLGAEHFPEDVVELLNYLVPQDGPASHPAPVPGRGYLPQVWLLGSSTFSAQLAGTARTPVQLRLPLRPGPGRRGRRPLPVELPLAPGCWPLPTSWSPPPCCAPTPTRRPGGWPVRRRSPCSSSGSGTPRTRGHAPRRRPPTSSPTRSGPSSRRPRPTTSSAIPTRWCRDSPPWPSAPGPTS